MPTTATTVNGNGAAPGARGRGGAPAQVLPVVPFVRASAEHREAAGIDLTRQLTTSSQDLGVFDIPAYGFLRSVLIVVTATGGTGTPTFAEDGPWSVLQNIALTEPNGAQIAQFNTGYDLYLANKWGGYRDANGSDPKSSPAYSQDATGNFTFALRIPLEINPRSGLGSLPNQNSASTFKLRLQLASGAAGTTTASVYSVVPTAQPNVRVQVYMEAWEQPAPAAGGMTNQVTPPALGTTQFWSTQIFNVNAGAQTIRLTRVGNYLRNLIFEYRRTSSTRANGDTDFPDPLTLLVDARPIDTVAKLVWKDQEFNRSGYGGRAPGGALTSVLAGDTAGGLDNGVFVYDFTHEFDGSLGRETNDLWLPTLGSTRLEIQGTFGNAGTLTVLTNDVAIAGTVFS